MRTLFKSFKEFLADTRGAITVDYVVLTAVTAGVGIAASDLVMDGYRALAANVNGELSGEVVSAEEGGGETESGLSLGVTFTTAFNNDANGWYGGSVTDVKGIGNVMQIAGSRGAQSIVQEFAIEKGVAEATFSFDLYALDSLDDESGIIFIDGQEVGRLTKGNSGTTFTPSTVAGITVTGKVVDENVSLGGNMSDAHNWVDSMATVSITVANPNEYVALGFGSDADQNVGNESFAVDNFTATGLQATS
ncbi:hypothetical protein [Jannaschia sp. 2305UL9-9]|uniref:hypothetical protein n=1 Tax=Jannaschia sp. 2305UL9-9 TaxID=3121638 RepID=UPI003527680D